MPALAALANQPVATGKDELTSPTASVNSMLFNRASLPAEPFRTDATRE